MKEMIFGLAAGMIAGAVLVRNCKPCAQTVDNVTSMVESKMNAMHKQARSSECECGSDCGCMGNQSSENKSNSNSCDCANS